MLKNVSVYSNDMVHGEGWVQIKAKTINFTTVISPGWATVMYFEHEHHIC